MSVDLIEIKKELLIPDLWFDFYARLIPGVAFASAVRYFIMHDQSVPSWNELAGLTAVGFFCALLTQSLASRVTGWIERAVELMRGVDKLLISKIQRIQGTTSRKTMILSKMHGEVTCFVQICLLSNVLAIISLVKSLRCSIVTGAELLALISLCSAFEVADRRLSRALRDKDVLEHIPNDGVQPEEMN